MQVMTKRRSNPITDRIGYQTLFALALLFNVGLAAEQEKPNILLIVADDLGYGDLGFQGSTDIQSPHLDRLAEGSIRWDNRGYWLHVRIFVDTCLSSALHGMDCKPRPSCARQ